MHHQCTFAAVLLNNGDTSQLVQLKDHSEEFGVKGLCGRVQELDKDLEACSPLASKQPLHPLQMALDRVGAAYCQQMVELYREEAHDLGRKDAQAAWNGVCFWLTRRLGPLPRGALNSAELTKVTDSLNWYADYAEKVGNQDNLVSPHLWKV